MGQPHTNRIAFYFQSWPEPDGPSDEGLPGGLQSPAHDREEMPRNWEADWIDLGGEG
jgi:hypothetical protein